MPASPISYALPTRQGLDSDEDWSRISDRKMKKRLQNRVAQREYRRRTRERIEGLTAELNKYRRQAQELGGEGSPQDAMSDGDLNCSESPRDDQEQPSVQSTASPQPQSQIRIHSPVGRSTESPQISPTLVSVQTQPVPSRLRSPSQEPPSSRLSAQPQILSGEQQNQHQPRRHHHGGVSELLALAESTSNRGPSSTIIPSLLQPMPLSAAVPSPRTQHDACVPGGSETRLSTHEMTSLGASTFHADETWRTPSSDPHDQAYHQQGDMDFMPIDMDDGGESAGKDHGSNEMFDDGMSTLLSHQTSMAPSHHPPAPRAPMQPPDARPRTEHIRALSSTDAGHTSLWDLLPSADDALEQKFEFLFDWLQHAGFGSLDQLLEEWYTGDFSDSSPLRQEQRLSRHRGLTTLLAKLRVSTQWSKWERWGYQEETLKGAESILRAEFTGLAEHARFRHLVAALNVPSGSEKVETIRAMKRCLQDELPQLRTLLTVATVDSSKAGRHANRKAIDAATIILSVAGHVSDADLLAMIQYVMQNGKRPREGGSLPGPSQPSTNRSNRSNWYTRGAAKVSDSDPHMGR